MIPGYIYILQNPLYGAYVVKIGLTKREPDTRARELYIGSSGVPAPFEIAVAYSVGDCRAAEKLIHKRFSAFRLNGRREFFRLSPDVAALVTLDTCTKINKELGLPPPVKFLIDKSIFNAKRSLVCDTSHDNYESKDKKLRLVALDSLISAPLGTSTLTPDQLDRIEILKLQLSQLFPKKIEEILNGFSHDRTPEREIRIWENITKTYLTIEQVDFASEELKMEAFQLLLMRSGTSTDDVLCRIKLKHFTPKAAKRLLQAYEMKPKPIIVRFSL